MVGNHDCGRQPVGPVFQPEFTLLAGRRCGIGPMTPDAETSRVIHAKRAGEASGRSTPG